MVAERALGLKMKVVAYDPFLAPEVLNTTGLRLCSENGERNIFYDVPDIDVLGRALRGKAKSRNHTEQGQHGERGQPGRAAAYRSPLRVLS